MCPENTDCEGSADMLDTCNDQSCIATSCQELQKVKIFSDPEVSIESGVYEITLNGEKKNIFCDMEFNGGGWTVIQSRGDFGRPEDYFLRDWEDYQEGFGVPGEDFWIGLDDMHNLTSGLSGGNELQLSMVLGDFEGNTLEILYDDFGVGSEDENYPLKWSSKDPNQVRGFNPSGTPFSTPDNDNDELSGNCAQDYSGGWWFKKCHAGNLNGLYLRGEHERNAQGVNWYHWKGHLYSLKTTEMKVRINYLPDCFEDNTEFDGPDLVKKADVSSTKECQDFCQGNEQCNFFTYGQNKCHLKEEGAQNDRRAISGLISGQKNCCFEEKVDYAGHDLDQGQIANVNTVEDCQKLCQDDENCELFSYFRSPDLIICYLKTAEALENSRPSDGSISGPKYCCYEDKIDYSSHNLFDRTGIQTIQDCQRLCQNEENCHHFTYHPARSRCFLKTEGANETPRPGDYAISGPKYCCMENDIDYEGHDISVTANVDTVQDCQELCDENDMCKYFTWGNVCLLKNSVQGSNNINGVTSGNKFC